MIDIATNDTLLESFHHLQLRRPVAQGPGQVGATVDEAGAGNPWSLSVDALLEWRRHPEQLEDEGLLPISTKHIDDALRILAAMRRCGWAAPSRVIPNTEGGISFERRHGIVFETIEIDGDGGVELRAFRGGRLMARKALEMPS